jgi:hypothetical protein
VSGERGVTTMRCRDRSWRPDAVQGLERRGIFEPVRMWRRIRPKVPTFVDLCGETSAGSSLANGSLRINEAPTASCCSRRRLPVIVTVLIAL